MGEPRIITCGCGKITTTMTERRKHLCSREHKRYQKCLEQGNEFKIELNNSQKELK